MADTPMTPTYPQYTNLALNEGLFDQIMATVKHHLQEEYESQRIRGDIYAKTYLGSMEAVLGNTTQYLLGILLIDEQKAKLTAETEKTDAEARLIEVEILKAEYELAHLLPAQVDLILAQIEKINKEIEYITAKVATEVANVDGTGVTEDSLIGRQRALLKAQKLGFGGDIESKVAKLHADYDAVFQTVQEVPESSALATNALAAIVVAEETATLIKNAT